MKDLYVEDLKNRFSGYTFTETNIGDMFKVDFKDGSSNVIASSTKNSLEDAYKSVRNDVLDGNGVLCESTSAQRALMTGIMTGTRTLDLTTNALLFFDGANWV